MHFCRISLWHHPEATRRFFTTTSTSKLDPDSYETQLKTLMQTLQPPTVHKQREQNSYVNTDLTLCSFVFIRHGAVNKPLQPPYDGSFKVLQWTNKHFTLDISGKKKVVPLDYLKPAHVDTSPVSDALSKTLTSQSHLPTSTSLPPSPSSSSSPSTAIYYSYHQVRPPCSLT